MNQDILIALLQNKNVYNQMIKEFPGLYSACLIIKQNVSKDAVEKSIEKIIKFYSNNEKFKLFIDHHIQIISLDLNDEVKNDVVGLVMVLDKKEDSYKKLMETAKKEKWQYKGIAIVESFDNIRLYFY